MFGRIIPEIPQLEGERDVGGLLYAFAKWLDSGYSHVGVESGDKEFSYIGIIQGKLAELAQEKLDPIDRLFCNMAESLVALMDERYDAALRGVCRALEVVEAQGLDMIDLRADAHALL